MAYPWAGPHESVLRIRRSSVPCSRSSVGERGMLLPSKLDALCRFHTSNVNGNETCHPDPDPFNVCSAFSKAGMLPLWAAGTFRKTISQLAIALGLSPEAAYP